MTVVSFRIPLNAQGWKIEPNCRYVMSDSFFRTIVEDLRKQGIPEDQNVKTWSCFNSYNKPYGGQDLNGRTLLIYRENGFGDNLMITGFVGYLRSLFPAAVIFTYGLPRIAPAWLGNTDANFLDVCPSFDAVKTADYHIFLEGFIENDNEPDQINCYDALLKMCSIDPKQVPTQYKKPQIFWTPDEDKSEAEWLQHRPKEDYVFWHWNPSGRARQYPDELAREAIGLLSEHFNVVVAGDTAGGIEGLHPPRLGVTTAIENGNPRIHNWLNRTPNIRALLPMIKHAKAVICPDSSVLHMASTFNGQGGTPLVSLVGLWGSFHPNDRAAYYANHTALHDFASCPSALCRAQRSLLPQHKCAQAKGWRVGEQFCRALYAITPEKIVEAVLRVTK